MSELIRVPDIGSGEGEVIELFVKVGDRIEAEQSLLTLESDKASMEIPAPKAGVVKSLKVKLGDRLKEGDELLELESDDAGASAPPPEPAAAPKAEAAPAAPATQPAAKETVAPAAAPAPASSQEIRVPDIGSAGKARVIEVLVKAGDTVSAEQSLITLESDKASMEIPSPAAGVVESIAVQLDAEVGTGDLILTLKVEGAAPAAQPAAPAAAPQAAAKAPAPVVAEPQKPAPSAADGNPPLESIAPLVEPPKRPAAQVHAGPAVRQLAREFGIDLARVTPTGPHGRVLKEDVQAYVKAMMQQTQAAPAVAAGGAGIPPIPAVDFSKFGEIEEVAMTRLMQVGAANLHRSWLNVPHVTQFESADITELEAFRVAQKAAAEKAGVKLTVLPLLLKACAHLLKEMPDFNSSLAPSGAALIRKKYVHIGFAVDTPDGLLVPVIRDVDQKSLLQLAGEAAELADKARNKKLGVDAMQGACFTISSLGHIGGTGFTPIVNAPEVAILGVSKATMQPVWDGSAFQPRLMLPLSLSYDHRVINGAAAARFTKRLSELLADIRTLLL
ncbi:dihydrolipoamide acetyltransferase [Pseudomonas flexibilis]|uniref:Acetyltransferase component of pyruvate dehydrogenase complex n=1 Tax=Pseudomonas flexibilis TaxID=706570 RepID=A0A1N6WEA7_9PSED|nr:dihydrolipoyllysine-residue acetyltransferase [Pseudomonas flexibilis]KHL71181.1 dihydrolipoamide acetyltransferase [Pseudomonas flexibilis]SIQ88483.1 pyruvate dehydrogenase E2 component (dihydrolipoamide acetyltransferase) [Pseudomonas flexibilis]